MGIEDLKFRLASQYVQANNGAKTEETKAKKQEKPEEIVKPQTKEVGDKLLTDDPKMAVMKDLGFTSVKKNSELTKTELPKYVNSKGQKVEVDISDSATLNRLSSAYKKEPFLTNLDEMQELNKKTFTEHLASFAKGIDMQKLDKHIKQPLSAETYNTFFADLDDKILAQLA